MAEDNGHFIEKMLELGIGLSMVRQMPSMLDGVMSSSEPPSGQTPPPVQTIQSQFYIVADNMQAGPFSDEEMIMLIRNDLLHPDTLVWKNGLSSWLAASQVPEINKLFLIAKIK